ncbi:MAG: hypothetical protein A7316_07515 [Candidatus Altiarchaeales archaeon WOR_SM1_86-2]|nr:MAG: hypothetical protein A7316_07515 [Candidatus Altiarchaeales archaeon WOR_SM1_86-2]
MNKNIKKLIESAPRKPGVYVWKDDGGRMLYVGKAENLRDRLRNYLSPQDSKTAKLVERAHSIETILTKTDTEALILEDALVKQNQPRYNVRLRDDKRYPYIRITVNEDYPKIEVVRRVELDGSRYFGPYTDAGSVRRVVNAACEIFGIRKCKHDLRNVRRPCINYGMRKCSAPCRMIGREEYAARVGQACRFLAGQCGRVKKELLSKIKAKSRRMEYEKAAELRDILTAIESLSVPQDLSSATLEDMDVLGYASLEGRADITQLKVRNKKVVAVLHYPLKGEYAGDSIARPFRGQKYKLSEMAVENSIHQLARERNERESTRGLNSLRKAIGLSKTPARIEGYDISNLGEKHTVGGMVVFTDGCPDKKQYRRFRIRGERGQDDPGSMAEMIRRRFNHPEWETPSLILLDGGKAQLNACLKHIPGGVPAAAIAKRFEEIHLPARTKPVRLAGNSPALLLLQQVRDEAHRYSRAYHLKKRGKEFIEG